MWHPYQKSDHVSIESTSKRGVVRFACRHCELGINVRLTGRSLAEYEARVDAFHFEHWHGGESTRAADRVDRADRSDAEAGR